MGWGFFKSQAPMSPQKEVSWAVVLLEPFLKDPCTQLGTSMCVPSAECLTL